MFDMASILAALGLHEGAAGGDMYGPLKPGQTQDQLNSTAPASTPGGFGNMMALAGPVLQGLLGDQKAEPQMPFATTGGVRPTGGSIQPVALPTMNPLSAPLRNRMTGMK